MFDAASEYVIELNNLTKKYGSQRAVHELNLKVPKGTVFGLLGPNGAGKTTAINMLMGLLRPSKGKVSVLGMDPFRKGAAVRQRVGYVPEVYGFYEWMTVEEITYMVANYHKQWNWTLYHELLDDFQLQKKVKVRNLSKGMKAKLALLLALAFKPEILVLDEPTGGLDPAARRNFIETILAHYQEEGKTIFVSSHLLNEFSGVLDVVAFMKDGNIKLVRPLEELHQKTKRIRLIFDDEVPADIYFSNALKQRTNGREMVLTYPNYDPLRTHEELRIANASNLLVEEMSLEDIFVDMVGS